MYLSAGNSSNSLFGMGVGNGLAFVLLMVSICTDSLNEGMHDISNML